MKLLTRKRKGSRDEIRYRLHTSIQAAAYLADDPSHEDIDRELKQIMKAGRAGTPLRPDRQSARDWSRIGWLMTLAVPLVSITFLLRGVPEAVLFVVLTTQVVPVLVKLVAVLSESMARDSAPRLSRDSALRLCGLLVRIDRRPDKAGQVTGSQREQTS